MCHGRAGRSHRAAVQAPGSDSRCWSHRTVALRRRGEGGRGGKVSRPRPAWSDLYVRDIPACPRRSSSTSTAADTGIQDQDQDQDQDHEHRPPTGPGTMWVALSLCKRLWAAANSSSSSSSSSSLLLHLSHQPWLAPVRDSPERQAAESLKFQQVAPCSPLLSANQSLRVWGGRGTGKKRGSHRAEIKVKSEQSGRDSTLRTEERRKRGEEEKREEKRRRSNR
ncbi:hypothetical protein INR49_007551 [Caranx melampygus]|nr:hypothetical protein INR49_007551 [Caranx melampygus]